MKVLPLLVLAHPGPQVRAYLVRMRMAGLRPTRILRVISSLHPTTHQPVARWLPRAMRISYLARFQETIQNHWPNRIRSAHPRLVEAIVRGLGVHCHKPAEIIREMFDSFTYERYADQVECVMVKDLRDPLLGETLSAMPPSAVLFTGGGLLPSRLLEIPGFRFIHAHPGHLPHVRGADGLLWSILIRDCPGMSAFYMAAGLDTGDLICAEDLPPVSFDLSGQVRPDDPTLYRAVFSFCDPLLRSEFLVSKVLNDKSDLGQIEVAQQDSSAGVTYHFMNPAIRRLALQRLFVSDKARLASAG